MHEPPSDTSDDDVLELIRKHWDAEISEVQHLAVGFGAWHWRASTREGPSLFVSLDPPHWHTAQSIERAYAGAASLAADLPFVHPPIASTAGAFTVPVGDGWLSATRWMDGQRPIEFTAEAADFVRQLHAVAPPADLPIWEPLVKANLIDELDEWVSQPWDEGPFGPQARDAVRSQLGALQQRLDTYLTATARLDPATYVTTHGEPDLHNQWRRADGTLFIIDWETIRRAPPERDLLGRVGDHVDGEPDMLQMFRIEWALSEVRSYSDWLRGPHKDDADTRVAFEALVQELQSMQG